MTQLKKTDLSKSYKVSIFALLILLLLDIVCGGYLFYVQYLNSFEGMDLNKWVYLFLCGLSLLVFMGFVLKIMPFNFLRFRSFATFAFVGYFLYSVNAWDYWCVLYWFLSGCLTIYLPYFLTLVLSLASLSLGVWWNLTNIGLL